MQKFQNMNIMDCISKINKVESMLEEIKHGLSCFDKEFQESIKRGEKDIELRKITVCKTEEELDRFFALV